VDTIEEQPTLYDGRRIEASRLVTRGTGNLVGAPLIFGRALLQLLFARMHGKVDVLHINVAAGGSAIRKSLLARLARHLDIPYVVHLHGSRFHTFWPAAGRWVRGTVDRFFLESSAVIVLGSYWSELVERHVPQVSSRVIVLPNATAPPRFARQPSSDGRVRISFLGELGERKGTPQLVEALGLLADCQNWTATIAGNGEVQETKERTRQLDIADRVMVPGWLGPDAVDELLRNTDIFVLPSFAENLPMSILEAFANGIAVVATPVGAVAEVITHESNGLLVPPGDVHTLASALRRLIEDGGFREGLGAAAQADHARYYAIGGYLSRLEEIWSTAIGRAN
jgi:glycosyltransferase involved in cell wall biosynthesis